MHLGDNGSVVNTGGEKGYKQKSHFVWWSDSDQVEVPAREKVVAAWGPGQVVYIIQMRPGLNILQMIHASEEIRVQTLYLIIW